MSASGERRPAASATRSPQRWDRDALRAGAAVALVFAVPLTLLAALLDTGNSGVNAMFFFGAILGFVLGGGCAAWVQRCGTPVSHGIVAAGATYVAAQAVFIAIRLVTGRAVNWSGALVTLSLVLVAGVIGGLLGQRLQDKGFVPSTRRTAADDRRDR